MSTTTTIPPDAGTEAFESCLADNGVSIDIALDSLGHPRLDVATEHLDFNDPVVVDAFAVCSPTLASGSIDLGDDQFLRSFIVGQLQAFSQCVRDKGVPEFPDPIPGFAGVGSPYSAAEIPYSNPLLAVAAEICRDRVLNDLPTG
jgi:hypothetical protein